MPRSSIGFNESTSSAVRSFITIPWVLFSRQLAIASNSSHEESSPTSAKYVHTGRISETMRLASIFGARFREDKTSGRPSTPEIRVLRLCSSALRIFDADNERSEDTAMRSLCSRKPAKHRLSTCLEIEAEKGLGMRLNARSVNVSIIFDKPDHKIGLPGPHEHPPHSVQKKTSVQAP